MKREAEINTYLASREESFVYTGFYKLYVDNKKIRIVYRLLGEEIEIIEVWGIGKRDKEEIYKVIGHRLKKKQ